jgi:uncharacterized membrane protein YdjX (TVP38/TMEM64 family)
MKSQDKNGLIWKVVRALPLVVVVILFTIFVVKNGVAAIDTLVEKFYERVWITTFAFLGLFLIKSVSFGLPYTLLYLGIGSIYPLGWALVLNTVGIIVNMQIPYFIGRYATGGISEKILAKFPQFSSFTIHKERKKYHDYYATGTWGIACNYDLTINSGKLSIELSVELIKEFIAFVEKSRS